MKENERHTASGFAYLVLMIVIVPLSVWGMIYFSQPEHLQSLGVVVFVVILVLDLLSFKGLFGVSPNQGAVLQLFGGYVGTERSPGLRWANPLYSKRFVSLRTRNFETSQLKVNDLEGNPIEFAAIVVRNVVDTAEACFQVDSYENYVRCKANRHCAT
jgi:regulator of protease activity HflC (stomatin/prohibitin superfamily)